MELPIFSDNLRSSAAWAVALAREREQWQRAQSSPATRAGLEARLRTQQVWRALQRAGRRIEEQQVAQLAAASLDPAAVAEMGADEQAAVRLLQAARLVSAWAAEPGAALTPERLADLCLTLAGRGAERGKVAPDDVFRRSDIAPLNPSHHPAPGFIVPRLVANALDWFTAPSFAEIHLVEQTALVFLRLLDLQPFPSEPEQTALLAASFYTERAGWPPLIIFADEASSARYTAAVEAAFRMLTQPLVEFFAESLAQTITKVLSEER